MPLYLFPVLMILLFVAFTPALWSSNANTLDLLKKARREWFRRREKSDRLQPPS